MTKKSTILLACALAFSSISVAQCPDGINGPLVVPAYTEQMYTLYDNINGLTVDWPHALVNELNDTGYGPGSYLCNPENSYVDLNTQFTYIQGGLITSASGGTVTVVWGAPGPGTLNLYPSGDVCDDTGLQGFCSLTGIGIDVLITPATNISEMRVDDVVSVTPTALVFQNTSLLNQAMVYTITGALVAQFSPKNRSTFDLQQLNTGIYVLKLIRMDGGVMTTKFSRVNN